MFQRGVRRGEALQLYRDILRLARRFHWCNEKGEPWSVVLRLNARKEFEQSRSETDPLLIAKMLAVGRQASLAGNAARFSGEKTPTAAWLQLECWAKVSVVAI